MNNDKAAQGKAKVKTKADEKRVKDAEANEAATGTNAPVLPMIELTTMPTTPPATPPTTPGGASPQIGNAIVPNNPFDPARYRLNADYQANLGIKKVITNLPCRKPNRHEWVRVRPGEEWFLQTMIFEDKIKNEFYLVEPNMVDELAAELVPVCLYFAINRQNDVFIWQVKLPRQDGRSNIWNDSAAQAAKLAQVNWIRVSSNTSAGYYDIHEADAQLSEPQWPELTFSQALEICFRNYVIRDGNHIAVKRLRGEVG